MAAIWRLHIQRGKGSKIFRGGLLILYGKYRSPIEILLPFYKIHLWFHSQFHVDVAVMLWWQESRLWCLKQRNERLFWSALDSSAFPSEMKMKFKTELFWKFKRKKRIFAINFQMKKIFQLFFSFEFCKELKPLSFSRTSLFPLKNFLMSK